MADDSGRRGAADRAWVVGGEGPAVNTFAHKHGTTKQPARERVERLVTVARGWTRPWPSRGRSSDHGLCRPCPIARALARWGAGESSRVAEQR